MFPTLAKKKARFVGKKTMPSQSRQFDTAITAAALLHPETSAGLPKDGSDKYTYRAVFISDTHLGTRAARVDLLLDFLKTVRCEQLYLIGDIIDGWQLKRNWFWDTTHNDVIRRILKMAKHGVKVVYVPGNHDEGLRGFEGHDLAGVSLESELIFEGAAGKRFWVLHGDQFDGVVKYAKWLAHVGDRAYGLLLRLNTYFNRARHLFGYDYWSLSAYLKHKVKNAVEYIGKFEEAVAMEAKRRGVDGVICGHIHHAECRDFNGTIYMNDGDWVESCTALVENDDGRFEILHWADEVAARGDGPAPFKKQGRKKKKNKRGNSPQPTPIPPLDSSGSRIMMDGTRQIWPEQNRRLNICIVTDAWHPQVNGVVRTLNNLRHELEAVGHTVTMLTPRLFKTIPCPTYPEIRLSINARRRTVQLLSGYEFDAIHIATEGPLGWAARRWCLKNKVAFTTAYHTAFPEYIAARSPLPARWFYPIFRRFHAPSAGVLVATKTVRTLLQTNGFTNIVPWTRGVDTTLFKPLGTNAPMMELSGFKRPLQLYVGRVAVEKNIEAFLACNTPGSKIIVGNGPALETLKAKYPDACFMGAKYGDDLAQFYANADVFVFPSRTDTFGLVMIEALAAGTPVAAYPVQGPLDVLGPGGCGAFTGWNKQVAVLDNTLQTAIHNALALNRDDCTAFAEHYDWPTMTQQFVSALRIQALPDTNEKTSIVAPATI